MKHTLQKVNNLDVLTFDDAATNDLDAREGSALAMVKWANTQVIGGATDWILPTRSTLSDLSNLNLLPLKRADISNYIWAIHFCDGSKAYKGGVDYVCLVRARQQYDIAKAALDKRFEGKK